MNPIQRSKRAAAACLLLSMTCPAWAQDAEADAVDVDVTEDAPHFETAPAEQGAFEAEVTVQGRYTADPLGSVSFEAKRYTGKLTVAEVLVDHGRVSPGQAVLRLAAPDLDEQLTDARDAVAKARQRLGWAEQEAAISETELAIGAERRGLSMADFETDYQQWRDFGKADAYLQAEMSMQQREDRFADQAQELSQLEELYKGARLASRTQDVVLERSRRDLAVAEAYLEIARRNYQVQMQQSLPRQERDMDNRMRWMQVEHEHAELRAQMTREKQVLSVESAREAVQDAEEKLAELEEDAGALVVKAEHGGVMSAIGLRVGDKVQSGQVIATLQDQAKGTLTAEVSATDLRVVQVGDRVEVRWVPFGEIKTSGTVELIAWQGQAGGADTTTFAITAGIDQVAPMIRPGMAADLRVSRVLANSAVSVPVEAVGHDDQGAYVSVQAGDGFERRAVVTGASNAERIQIIEGLDAGETVRVPAE